MEPCDSQVICTIDTRWKNANKNSILANWAELNQQVELDGVPGYTFLHVLNL